MAVTPTSTASGVEQAASEVISTLGPGLISGAADDDPSGIATYSQAGAQFGLGLLWTVPVQLPMMIAVQSIAARVGCVTGKGLAANLGRVAPRWLVLVLVMLLLLANVINIAADIAAMGSAGTLLLPGVNEHLFVIAFAGLSLLLQLFLPYERYVNVLKWLTAALLAYVAVVFAVKIDWAEVALRTLVPRFELNRASLMMIVALFGTTISPYLFFWQSSQEVEDIEADDERRALRHEKPRAARDQIKRIGADTIVGMAFSQLIAFFVILTAAVTLNAHGVDHVQTAAQAAQALRPIAGPFASVIFSLGIIGTGLLAVPVLAGSAAYAMAEVRGWEHGLSRKVLEAKEFYAIIAFAMLGGIALSFSPIEPIKALFYSAVINGVAAVPILTVTIIVASRKDIMGGFVATPMQKLFGWLATAFMALAAAAMPFGG